MGAWRCCAQGLGEGGHPSWASSFKALVMLLSHAFVMLKWPSDFPRVLLTLRMCALWNGRRGSLRRGGGGTNANRSGGN